jgi:hypothetical protein
VSLSFGFSFPAGCSQGRLTGCTWPLRIPEMVTRWWSRNTMKLCESCWNMFRPLTLLSLHKHILGIYQMKCSEKSTLLLLGVKWIVAECRWIRSWDRIICAHFESIREWIFCRKKNGVHSRTSLVDKVCQRHDFWEMTFKGGGWPPLGELNHL